MFKTFQGVTEDAKAEIYLRPETAQGIFVNFKNVLRTTRKKLPMGIEKQILYLLLHYYNVIVLLFHGLLVLYFLLSFLKIIGTPYCVTIDFDTLEDNTVTIRDRDTMEQIRLPIEELNNSLIKS